MRENRNPKAGSFYLKICMVDERGHARNQSYIYNWQPLAVLVYIYFAQIKVLCLILAVVTLTLTLSDVGVAQWESGSESES